MNSLARLTGWLAGRVGGAGEASRCVAPKLNIPALPIIFPRLHSNEFQETSNLPSYVYSLVWLVGAFHSVAGYSCWIWTAPSLLMQDTLNFMLIYSPVTQCK